MKKIGFTLAEILITLSIIGVVSALTAPSLVGSYQKSKVGPSLKKFINTIETANQQILMDKMSNTLSGALGGKDVPYTGDLYLIELQKYVKGYHKYSLDTSIQTPKAFPGNGQTNSSNVPTTTFGVLEFSDGSSLGISSEATTRTYNAGSSYKGAIGNMFYYDINGFQNSPNVVGRDIFAFIIDNSGTVIPYGSRIVYDLFGGTLPRWSDSINPCTGQSVGNGLTCAGSVIDNDGKVIYKY